MNKKLLFLIIPLAFFGIIGFRLITKTNQNSDIARSMDAKNLHHLTIKIDGMYCASCPYIIENALKDTAGVVNATVGFVGKQIINGTVEGQGEVVYDANKTNPQNLLQAILPYKGVLLKDEKTNSTELVPLSKTFVF